MITRKRILALLFTAISLLGLLPLSVSAYTPAIVGVEYTYTDPTPDFPATPDNPTPFTTDITGTFPYMAFEGSPIEGFENITIDVINGTVNQIGYLSNTDGWSVYFESTVDVLAYVPGLTQFPTYLDDIYCEIAIIAYSTNDVFVVFGTEMGSFITYAVTDIKFTLTEILPTTDMTILNNTLKAFTAANLTADNYVNWFLGGYNGIIDVFVNNAKIQYVMDNPIFIIALVVFAMAIAFAVATFIFKIFRRY